MKITNKNHVYNNIYYTLEIKKQKITDINSVISPEYILQNEKYFDNAFEYFTENEYELIKKYKSIKAIKKYIKKYELDSNEQQFWVNEAVKQKIPVERLELKNLEYMYTLDDVYALERLIYHNYIRDYAFKNHAINNIILRRLALNPLPYIFEITQKHLFADALAIRHAYAKPIESDALIGDDSNQNKPSDLKFDYSHLLPILQKIHKNKPNFYVCYLLNTQPTKKMLKESVDYNMISFLNDDNFITCCFNHYLQQTKDNKKETVKECMLYVNNVYIKHNRKMKDMKSFVIENIYVPEKVSEFLSLLTSKFDKEYDFLDIFYDLDYKKYQDFYKKVYYINHKIILDFQKIEYFTNFAFYKTNLIRNFDPLNYKCFLSFTIENKDFINKYFYYRKDMQYFLSLIVSKKEFSSEKDKNTSNTNIKSIDSTFDDCFMLLCDKEPVLVAKKHGEKYLNSFRTYENVSIELLQTKLGIFYIMMNYKRFSKENVTKLMKANKTLDSEINNVLDEFIWHNCDDLVSILPYFKKIYDNTLESILDNKKEDIVFSKYLKYKAYEKECINHIINNYTLSEILNNYYLDTAFVMNCIKSKVIMNENYVTNFIFLFENVKNNNDILFEVLKVTNYKNCECIFDFLAIQKMKDKKNIIFIDFLARKHKKLCVRYFELYLKECTIKEAQVLLQYKEDYDKEINDLKDSRFSNNRKEFENNLNNKIDEVNYCDNTKCNELSFCTKSHCSDKDTSCQEKNVCVCINCFIECYNDFCSFLSSSIRSTADYCTNYAFIANDDPILLVTDLDSFITLLQIYKFYKPFIFYHFDLILENITDFEKKTCNTGFTLKKLFLDEQFVYTIQNKVKKYIQKNIDKNNVCDTKSLNLLLFNINNHSGYFTEELFALSKTISLSKAADKLLKTTDVEDFVNLPTKEMVNTIMNTTFEYYLDKRSEILLLYKLKEVLNNIKRDKSDIEHGKNVLKIILNLHNILIGYDFLGLQSYVLNLLCDERFTDEISEIFRKWVHFDKQVIHECTKMLELDLRVAKVLVSILLEIEGTEEQFVEDIVMKILNIKKNEWKEFTNTENNINGSINNNDGANGIISSTNLIFKNKIVKKESDNGKITDTTKNSIYTNNITDSMSNFLAYAPSLRCFKKHKHLFVPLLKNIFLTAKYKISVKSFIKIFDSEILYFLVQAIFVNEKGFEALQIFEEVLKKNQNSANKFDLVYALIFVLKFSYVEKIKRKAFELWITYFKKGLIKRIMKDLINLITYKKENEGLFVLCFDEVFDKYNEILYEEMNGMIESYVTTIDNSIDKNTKNDIDIDTNTNTDNDNISNTNINGMGVNISNKNSDTSTDISSHGKRTDISKNNSSDFVYNIYKESFYSIKMTYNSYKTELIRNIIEILVQAQNKTFFDIAYKITTILIDERIILLLLKNNEYKDKIIDLVINNKIEYEFLLENKEFIDKLFKKTKDVKIVQFTSDKTKMKILNEISMELKNCDGIKKDCTIKKCYNEICSCDNTNNTCGGTCYSTNNIHKGTIDTCDSTISTFGGTCNSTNNTCDSTFNTCGNYICNGTIKNKSIMKIPCTKNICITNIFENAVIDQNFDFAPFFENITPSKEWESFLCSVDPIFSFFYLSLFVCDFGGLKNLFERTFDSLFCVDALIDSFYCEYLKDVTFKNITNYKKLFYVFLEKKVYKRFAEIFDAFYDDEMLIELLKVALHSDVESVLKDIKRNKKDSILDDYLYAVQML